MKTAEIMWEPGRYASQTGLVNGRHLFTLNYVHGTRHELSTTVPVADTGPSQGDADTMKARAVEILARFVGDVTDGDGEDDVRGQIREIVAEIEAVLDRESRDLQYTLEDVQQKLLAILNTGPGRGE
jgi:hypothetical protein